MDPHLVRVLEDLLRRVLRAPGHGIDPAQMTLGVRSRAATHQARRQTRLAALLALAATLVLLGWAVARQGLGGTGHPQSVDAHRGEAVLTGLGAQLVDGLRGGLRLEQGVIHARGDVRGGDVRQRGDGLALGGVVGGGHVLGLPHVWGIPPCADEQWL